MRVTPQDAVRLKTRCKHVRIIKCYEIDNVRIIFSSDIFATFFYRV